MASPRWRWGSHGVGATSDSPRSPLLALAVAKVFLYDMATLEAGWRVLSLVVLGVLLLVAAFAYQRMTRARAAGS